jgi:tetratricopeptide (TPR) repeat protein
MQNEHTFWQRRGYLGEGRLWMARALDAAGSAFPELRGPLLLQAAWLALWQSDFAAVQSYCEANLGICQATGDQRGMATSLALLGTVAEKQGDYALGRSLLEQSLALGQAAGGRDERAFSLRALGWVALDEGDLPTARSLIESALAIWRELGDPGRIGGSLPWLAKVDRHEENYEEAQILVEEGLTLARRAGVPIAVARGVLELGLLLVRQSEYPAARAAFEEGIRIGQEIGSTSSAIRCFEGMAQLAWAQGEPRRGARLFGAAEALREVLRFPLPPVDRVDYDCVPAITTALGEEAFAAAWAEGRALTIEQAVVYALADPGADAPRQWRG